MFGPFNSKSSLPGLYKYIVKQRVHAERVMNLEYLNTLINVLIKLGLKVSPLVE